LDNTPTIITKTGFFDTVDKLYKPTSGVTQQSSEQPAETPDGGGELPPMGETLPENKNSDNLNLLLENDDILGDTYFDLSKGNNSLGLIENELSKILKD